MHHTEVALIAQKAWDKTKAPSDPVWNECDSHHRQVFLAHAQAVVDSGHAVNDFEAAVKKLAQEATEKREVIEEVRAENPTAHADELPLIAAKRGASPEQPFKPSSASFNPPSSDEPSQEKKSPRKTKAKPHSEAVKSSKKSSKKGK